VLKLQPPRESRPEQPCPTLTPEHISRIAARGRRRSTARGDVLVEVGDRVVPSFLVVSGEIRALRTFDGAEMVNTSLRAGELWSEGSLLSGRQSLERLRVSEPGEVIELSGAQLLALMKTDAELREILMRPFILRRLELIARNLTDVIVINALHARTDDDETKPFGTDKVLARIQAMLGLVETFAAPIAPISRGGLVIDRERFRVFRDGEHVRLTPKEFELLTFLARHPGRVHPRVRILEAIWGPNAVDRPEQLRVLVGSLRRKIEPNPAAPKYILTEPWIGYRFTDE
jgi:two-component system KDP operon response regulator KdpE